jgi:hypothetical protein
MGHEHPNNFHNSFCANRSIGTAAILVAACAVMVFAGWRGASGKPHPPDSGVFFFFYEALAIWIAGMLFIEFKCLRERTVIGLSLVTSVGPFAYAALPSLARFRPTVNWIEFAAWTTAFFISLSMLISTFRSRKPAEHASAKSS